MLKKTFAVVGLATALVLGGSAAALADYPDTAPVTVSDTTPAPGQPITITATDLGDHDFVTFSTSGAGASLASIVLASGSGVSVDKTVSDNGSASATFTASQEGSFVINVHSPEGDRLQSVTLVVDAANAGTGSGSGSGTLPATGGNVPGAVIWAGVGAVGLGGIAVAAVAARRRAASQN